MNTCWRCDRDFEYDSFSDGMEECEPCHLRQSIELLQKDNQRLNNKLTELDPYICELQEGKERAEEAEAAYRELWRSGHEKTKNVQAKLDTEREGLTSWMRSRRAQQEQLFKMSYVSDDTKRIAEIEVGFIDRYLAVIEKGMHRNNNPRVSDPNPKEFKSLRTMERDDIISEIEKSLDRAVQETRNETPGTSKHSVLITQQSVLISLLHDLRKLR